ncbi:sodium/glucose cotransporter 4-like isoform X1 [Eriocheir sinensis]|uniref:sodium/glucose cotransporter 4-like isoform X1 n=1 Tax=Eriocheir sinensis TaxID=95602 RepID=UPI0021C5D51A|nr:sodium/glucose cotransporter 4-like isoform X1 [Eriocheir sinensis]
MEGRRESESSWRSERGSTSGYFLGGRNMHWIPVGASLFASNIGSGHFIGLAGSGAASGIGVAGFEQSAIYILMLLGWLFVPVYTSSQVYTMPEYLKERFGGQRIRVYLSFLALLLYIFTKISADLYAGALFIQLALNKTSSEWLYLSILFLLAVAAIFTIAGGLTAVVWTDFVQTILMIFGALILMVMSFKEVGGYTALVERYPYAVASVRAVGSNNATCGEPPADYMNLLRTIEPGKSNFPWTGMVFGLTINSIWYWCTDQVIVQRTLASRNMIHAKAGCILASYLKFLPLWLLVFPGMAARILYPDRVACASPEECQKICGSPGGCSNIAYAELVLQLLPQGLSGLMLAVMMAALMSSLTSIFNSASTIFTVDVWTLVRKWGGKCCRKDGTGKISEREKLIVGRVFVAVLVGVSVIWIPVIQNTGNSQLFDYIQSISSFLAPPICAVYLLAIFWARTTEPGAFWGLMVGLAIGLLRFILEFSYTVPACGAGDDTRGQFLMVTVAKVHYLHFSCILWIITGVVTISISLMTCPIPEHSLYRLTYWSRKDDRPRVPIEDAYKTPSVTNGRSMHVADPDHDPNKLTPVEEAKNAAASLYEPPFWKAVVNWNAIICLVLSTFVIGFFA